MGQYMTTQRGGQGAQMGAGGDDLPWWFKYLGRAFGIIGGSLAVIFGALNCISVTPKCIAAGLVLIFAGIIALILEAPCCFVFFDFGDKLARWSESRKPWHKVVLFVVLSIPPVCIYQGPFTILGGAFLFLTGVAYGLMNLGKKASREEMAEKARELDSDIDKLKLVFSEKKPATSENGQTPQEFTGDVNIETPSTVVSMNPASPSKASSSAAPVAPSRGMGYSPLQNQFSTEANAPVVMSPVDFDSPGPSPAYVGGPPASTSGEFKFADPKTSYSFGADIEQPFGEPQPQSTPVLPPPPAQQHRRQGGGGAGGINNLINF